MVDRGVTKIFQNAPVPRQRAFGSRRYTPTREFPKEPGARCAPRISILPRRSAPRAGACLTTRGRLIFVIGDAASPKGRVVG